jgi:hypothetical protein
MKHVSADSDSGWLWPRLSGACAVAFTFGCGADAATSAAFPVDTPADAGSPASGADAGPSGGGTGGGPANSSPGTGSTGPLTTTPSASVPDALCQQFTIGSGRITPDMLIVLDRSSSMVDPFFGLDRWTPSVSGLKAITAELDDLIRFGLMAFPGRGSDFTLGGGMQCAPGTLEVPIALNTAPTIAASLDSLQLVQTTPTAPTLMAAHAVLGSGLAQLDTTLSAKYVILVTDGAPNCSDGRAGGGGLGGDQAAVAASVAAIAAMQMDGIKTYVLGYGTESDPVLKAALDQMAQAGGTGDSAHRPIENEASLVQEFRRILGSAVSCDYALMTAPSDPNYVLVQLDGVKLDLNSPDGFALSDDRKRLTVVGAACTTLQSTSEPHMLTVKVECERQTLF